MMVNSCSGVVGLTENPAALESGGLLDLSRHDEERILPQHNPHIAEKHYHHEEKFSAQKLFKQQFLSLVQVFHDMGNHFLKHLLRAVEPEPANCNG